MSTKTKQAAQTDRAWKILHTRLLEDGLVEKTPDNRSKHAFLAGKWQWAAAILLIGGSLAFFFGLKNQKPGNNEPLLTLRNDQAGSTLVKTLEDGSVIYLAGDTELTYPEHFDREKRMVSLKGNALFEVTGSKTHPFLIHTAYTEIEVIGTSFEVKSLEKEGFELSVLEGEVKVMSRISDKVMYVKAGDAVTITPQGDWQYMAIRDTGMLERIMETLQFKNEPVGNIIRIINKNQHTVSLAIHPSLEYRRLSVTFSGQTPEEIAEILAIALGITYKEENGQLMLSD
ncbi:MAG: FecR family protein [Tannerellaceae bacterium]|nr:FecR family protein [Tannerellaceae bacterium]